VFNLFVTVLKDFNCKRYYETKHASTFDDVGLKGAERNNKTEEVKKACQHSRTFSRKSLQKINVLLMQVAKQHRLLPNRHGRFFAEQCAS